MAVETVVALSHQTLAYMHIRITDWTHSNPNIGHTPIANCEALDIGSNFNNGPNGLVSWDKLNESSCLVKILKSGGKKGAYRELREMNSPA